MVSKLKASQFILFSVAITVMMATIQWLAWLSCREMLLLL